MYYIYHIPGIKIGCTNDLHKRMKDQGFNQWEILEQHEDGWHAGNREIELQKEYGYPVDKCHYMISKSNRPAWTKEAGEKGRQNGAHILGGKWHKGRPKSNDWKSKMDFGGAFNTKRITCIHCNTTTNSGNYTRWHGDNCKHKKRDQ